MPSLRLGKPGAGVQSPSGKYLIFVIICSSVPVHPSFSRINCVAFLSGAVIELDTGSILIEWCPSTTGFRLAYVPGSRTGYSILGLL